MKRSSLIVCRQRRKKYNAVNQWTQWTENRSRGSNLKKKCRMKRNRMLARAIIRPPTVVRDFNVVRNKKKRARQDLLQLDVCWSLLAGRSTALWRNEKKNINQHKTFQHGSFTPSNSPHKRRLENEYDAVGLSSSQHPLLVSFSMAPQKQIFWLFKTSTAFCPHWKTNP